MPDFVVVGQDTIPVPRELRGNPAAIAAWIEKQTKAAPKAAKEA